MMLKLVFILLLNFIMSLPVMNACLSAPAFISARNAAPSTGTRRRTDTSKPGFYADTYYDDYDDNGEAQCKCQITISDVKSLEDAASGNLTQAAVNVTNCICKNSKQNSYYLRNRTARVSVNYVNYLALIDQNELPSILLWSLVSTGVGIVAVLLCLLGMYVKYAVIDLRREQRYHQHAPFSAQVSQSQMSTPMRVMSTMASTNGRRPNRRSVAPVGHSDKVFVVGGNGNGDDSGDGGSNRTQPSVPEMEIRPMSNVIEESESHNNSTVVLVDGAG